jgi:23S rRNA-/tRNA-specific pseudouridylate synthase
MDKTKPKKKAIKNEYYELKPSLIKKYNLRFIEPYEFKYQLYTKGRWVNKKILNVLTNEFRQYNEEYFIKALKTGKLKINNEIVDPDYVLQKNDFITHLVIRKENPIIDQKLSIVFEDEEYLVVDKPSSWPVHVCGGYQFNTLHRIVMDEYGYKSIKVLHRLDKHTSGIVIFAKNKKAAEIFRQNLHSDKVEKIYLCRVKGDFQPEKVNVQRHIVLVNSAKGIYTDSEYYATDNIEDKYDKSGVKIKKDGDENNGNEEEDDGNIILYYNYKLIYR